ncbi:retrovirus-related pol polyprotein from transposon TNT 1-94 [Tanacetum coccineum]
MEAVFNQMETEVAKCSIDKKYFKTKKKEISHDNDRLLEHIICQDVMNIVMHADSLPVNVQKVVEKDATPNNAKVITLGMFKLDLEPLAHKVLKNRDTHIDYIMHTRVHADTLREIVENARALRPLDSNLNSACQYVQRIHEVLVYIKDTCPCLTKPSKKLVAITPLNKTRRVRFAEPCETSKDITHKQVNPQEKQTTSNSVSPSTGVSSSTEASGSMSKSNAKKDRIPQTSSNLEVAFRKHTCYVQNLEGADLISRSRDTNLYTIPLDDMLKSSPICKRKKSSHKPKADDTNQEKLYLLHMDLCGPMRVESVNGKKYILDIFDDYSRFTWVMFLRLKDGAPDVIIK